MFTLRRPLSIAFVALVGLASGPAAWGETEVLLDGVAAQVGNEIVLMSEVEELAAPMEQRLRGAGAQEAQIASMRRDALERLIDGKLISNMVTRFEMGATPDEIDNAVAGIAQSNGLTVKQLQASVENHGLTIAEYRAKLKEEIERSKLINAMVSSRVRVEPEEIEKLFLERYGDQSAGGDEVRLRHILVATGAQTMRDDATACAVAADAVAKIRAGQLDFREAARQITDMNPQQQGELGWLHTNEIAPWMAKAISGLKPGETTDPIPMPFGCNVLQVVEYRTFTPVTLEQAQPSLRTELVNQKTDREIMVWLESVREQTFISRKGEYAEGPKQGDSARRR